MSAIKPSDASFLHGIYFELSPERVEELRKMIADSKVEVKTEVTLDYGGKTRACSFDELIAFMEGRS